MGDISAIASNFDLGFRSDTPRDQLPPNCAYRMKDWIPRLGAPLERRGAWTNASRDLNAQSSLSRIEALGWGPFLVPTLLALSNNGKLFTIKQFDGTNVANCGLLVSSAGITNPVYPPFWHKDRVIFPDSLFNQQGAGTHVAPQAWDSSTLAALGGTPPQFTCGASWGDYVVGANGFVSTTRYPNRAWWSAPGDPNTWPVTTSYWDFPEEIVGVVTKSNMLMFFGYRGVHLLLGTQPPPGGDFTLRRYAFDQGCMDGRSIAQYQSYVIWANNNGVFRTDGSTITNLTEQGGVSNYWRSLMAGNSFYAGSVVSAGIYRGHYIVTIMDKTHTTITTLVCDLERMVWFQFTNTGAFAYAARTAGPGALNSGGFEELFFSKFYGSNLSNFVANTSAMWTPQLGSDPDLASPLPILETPFYRSGSPGMKRIRRVFLNYYCQSASLQVSYVGDPEGTSYTDIDILPANTKFERRPAFINQQMLGVGLKIKPNAVTVDLALAGIDLEARPYELVRQ